MSAGKKAGPDATSAIFLRLTPDQRRRFRRACVDDDVTYAQFVLNALDARDRRVARRPAVAASPLHAGIEDE
jgi:uncharacterized protein (DUF1778 family)